MDNIVSVSFGQGKAPVSVNQKDAMFIRRLELCIREINGLADYLHYREQWDLARQLRLVANCATTVVDIARPQ